MKVKKQKNGFTHKGIIYNNTIRVDDEESSSTFLCSYGSEKDIFVDTMKLK